MNKKIKVMVIGLDGATFDIIKPWVQKGLLPNFQNLIKEGVHGNLLSTIPFATIPAWPSFSTGCNPGKHGFYDFFKESSDGYTLTVEMSPSCAVKQLKLWEILSDFGKTVAVINVPDTSPPSPVNGYMITGLLTPPNSEYTYPIDFKNELENHIGKYNVFFSALSSRDPEILLLDLEKTLEMRVKALEYLWTEKQPDFLMMVDNGTDRAEHELWKFLDPLNPQYDSNEAKRYENPLLTYYQIVDKALGRITKLLDDQTVLILMSDHGQESLWKFVNLNMFLIQEGYISIKKNIISKLRFFLFRNGFSPRNLYTILRKIGIERYASDKINPRTSLFLLNNIFFSTSDINWAKTKAFASGVTGAITINLKGRQPRGIVNPGKEYEKLRDEISKKLINLRDSEDNTNVVDKVYRREEIYHGPYLDQAPDLVATSNNHYEFFGMHGFTFHRVIEKTFANSGDHTPDGIFLAKGAFIKKCDEITGAEIIDVAPTILRIMNIPIPPHMDGKILTDIFNKNYIFDEKKSISKVEDREKILIRSVVKKIKK